MEKTKTEKTETELKEFDVDVRRLSVGHGKFRVKAKDATDAEQKGIEAACNYVFSEKSSEYEVDFVEEVNGDADGGETKKEA